MRNARIHSFGFGDSDDDADLKAEPPAGRLRARVGQRSTALRRLGAPTRLPDRIDLDPRLSRTGEPVSPAVLLGRTDVPLWHPGPRGRLVVVAPHPDDETLGAGGIIHDLCAGGWTVTVVAVTDGEAAYGRDDASAVERLAAIRRQEQSRAIAHLGKVDVLRVGVPDGEVANAAARLHSFLLGAADGAAYLLSTWRKDGHPDHEAAGDVTARVARELGVPFGEFAIWAWHWAEPADLPQSRMQVWALSPRAHIAKREALRAFASQTNPTGRPPVLPAHLVARLLRPIEVLLV